MTSLRDEPSADRSSDGKTRSFRCDCPACAILLVVSRLGLLPWKRLHDRIGGPVTTLVDPAIGPKVIQLLAGLALCYLLLCTTVWLLTRPRVLAIAGTATIIAVNRLAAFAWIPVCVAMYLIFRIDMSHLDSRFVVQGDAILLTVPTIVAMIVFGLAIVTRSYQYQRNFLPRALRYVADAIPLLVALCACVALNQLSAEHTRPWSGHVARILTAQTAIIGVAIAYVLLIGEALHADWVDVRSRSARHRALVALIIARAIARLALFSMPIIVGIGIATQYEPDAAGAIKDRNGELITIYYPAGVYRMPVKTADISPWMFKAVESIEHPGLCSSPETHLPINPVRVAGIFTSAAQTIGDENALSGGSGIAVQACKNVSGRPLVRIATRLPSIPFFRRGAIGAAMLTEKFVFEFPCGWTCEEVSLFTHRPDRAPLTQYLSQVYFGEGAYGVEAAARTYFNTSARDLTIGEAALLAGLPQAPSALNPWARRDTVMVRRGQVIAAMVRQGYITPAHAATINSTSLGVGASPSAPPTGPIDRGFIAHVVEELADMGYDHLSKAGLTITTTLDRTEKADLVGDSIRRLRDHGGSAEWAATMLIDPKTGDIRAWATGRPSTSVGAEAIRPTIDAVGAFPHQPGSAIKPFIYSCALEKGVLRPDELLDDTERIIGGKYIANWDLTSQGMQPAAVELTGSRGTRRPSNSCAG
jgi:hypothetical protein